MVPLKEVQPFSEKNMFGGSYRNYESSTRQDKVEKTYSDMHVQQTVVFVKTMREKWMKFDKGEYTIMEAIEMLDELVDDSDPDVDIPNSLHDFQTAERIREQWPGEEYDWFHLVGLLHGQSDGFAEDCRRRHFGAMGSCWRYLSSGMCTCRRCSCVPRVFQRQS